MWPASVLDGEFADLARERGYLQAGSCPSGLRPLLKKVAGLPGDTVHIGGIANIVIAALPIESGGKPYFLAQSWNMTRQMQDSKGRHMPSVLEDGVIPPGMALLLADHPGSFDSRYFGLVPLDALQRVEPVFIFNPQQGELP
jgi:conjugative transfer signal peptidase TraF